MSPGGISLMAPVQGRVGEHVVAYLDHIGRVEGLIARDTQKGFAVQMTLPASKRDKIADQLTWLFNRDILGLPEERRHERIEPNQKHCAIALDDREEAHICQIIDISISGIAIETTLATCIGGEIRIGSRPARVVRHFENGFAAEFAVPIPVEEFSENIQL
jgi:hypothetical protein